MTNGYAIVDRQSRMLKARKIAHLIGGDLRDKRLLDLGAGTGILSEYFKSLGAHVTAADRSRDVFNSDVPFVQTDEGSLAFDDSSFDIIVFNHVIEHVGDQSAQRKILAEIARVLAPDGQLYLAVPNKWALVEPHFRLPLLGALPRTLADALVRLSRKGDHYDCYPLSQSELVSLISEFFGKAKDRCDDAADFVIENELGRGKATLMRALPRSWWRSFYPTLVMTCSRPHQGA